MKLCLAPLLRVGAVGSAQVSGSLAATAEGRGMAAGGASVVVVATLDLR